MDPNNWVSTHLEVRTLFYFLVVIPVADDANPIMCELECSWTFDEVIG